jgi:hypothetical protein
MKPSSKTHLPLPKQTAETIRSTCEAEIAACIDILARKGVSKHAILELQDELFCGNYIAVMKRCQQYFECCDDTKLDLPWMQLNQCLQYQYTDAYRDFHNLRRVAVDVKRKQQRRTMGQHLTPGALLLLQEELDAARQRQLVIAELCTACQREIILHHRRMG